VLKVGLKCDVLDSWSTVVNHVSHIKWTDRTKTTASARKIDPSKRQKVADNGISTGTQIVSGIQFVDMTILSSVFSILAC
jgi:hypothetical protein